MTRFAPSIAPTITTDRLVLRGHCLDDFADCAAMWGDPVVTRHIGGRPFTTEEVWARLLRYVGHWAMLGFGTWTVRDKATGRFLGEVGFADNQRDIDPPFGDRPEMGWVLVPCAHGQGVATEAVRAALAWGDVRFGATRTRCMIDPDNAPSIRVAEKCGYHLFAHATYKGQSTLLFER